MNRDDIIRMAREAGLCDSNGEDDDSVNIARQLQRFAALVAAAEREVCAKVCDERKHYWQRDDIRRHEDEHCATAIRARGNACSNRPENK